MTPNVPATEFPLRFYSSNPNSSDMKAGEEFKSNYNRFVTVMGGVRPKFMNAFTDFSKEPSEWASSAAWSAWSWEQTGDAYVGPNSGTSPVIGVPMASNSQGWKAVDDFYKKTTDGKYDDAWYGIVKSWSKYNTIYVRIGYDFNGNFMPWAPGNSPKGEAKTDFVKAWRHIANVMRSAGSKLKIAVKTVWNPADINYTNFSVTDLYPGNDCVDIIATDTYSITYKLDKSNWADSISGKLLGPISVLGMDQNDVNDEHYWMYSNANQWNPKGQAKSGWSMQQTIQLARLVHKPIAIGETGSAQNSKFPQWLQQALTQPNAPKVAFVNIWSTNQSDGAWGFIDGQNPDLAQAWKNSFGSGSTSHSTISSFEEAPLEYSTDH